MVLLKTFVTYVFPHIYQNTVLNIWICMSEMKSWSNTPNDIVWNGCTIYNIDNIIYNIRKQSRSHLNIYNLLEKVSSIDIIYWNDYGEQSYQLSLYSEVLDVPQSIRF